VLLAAALGLGLCASGCAGAARAVLPAPAPGLLPAAAPGPAPAPSIAFNASSFTNGDFVSVAWVVPQYDAVGAARTDMVALFLANASDPQLNLPIKYKWAASADGYTANGAGSHTWAPGSVPPLLPAAAPPYQLLAHFAGAVAAWAATVCSACPCVPQVPPDQSKAGRRRPLSPECDTRHAVFRKPRPRAQRPRASAGPKQPTAPASGHRRS